MGTVAFAPLTIGGEATKSGAVVQFQRLGFDEGDLGLRDRCNVLGDELHGVRDYPERSADDSFRGGYQQS